MSSDTSARSTSRNEKPAYAGIGSRLQSFEATLTMMRLGAVLAARGYRLQSGGAPGADEAFEIGATEWLCRAGQLMDKGARAFKHNQTWLQITLPWKGFGDFRSRFPGVAIPLDTMPHQDIAQNLVEQYHSAPEHLSPAQRKLMARNGYQVLGGFLDAPVTMVVCATLDGCIDGRETTRKTGGTGQGLRIATAHSVPIFNIEHEPHLERITRMLAKHSEVLATLDDRLQALAHERAVLHHDNARAKGHKRPAFYDPRQRQYAERVRALALTHGAQATLTM